MINNIQYLWKDYGNGKKSMHKINHLNITSTSQNLITLLIP